jgi:hypothetical protein
MTLGFYILNGLCLWLVLHLYLEFHTTRIEKEYYKKRGDKNNKRYYEDNQEKCYPKLCKWYNGVSFGFCLTSTLVTLVLFFFLLFTAGGQYCSTSFIKEYESVAADYMSRKENFTEYERAAIFTKATEMNARLAALKFRNEACFGIFDSLVTDDINKLQPIR